MKYYEDPILGKGRAADVTGGTGGSGTTYIGGFAIGISGDTISRLRYMPIESVTGNSVTLQAGHAYKAYATSTAITLNTETVPANEFGMEGHIEIYVAGTGYVVTGTNVVLANALDPDSVNNCTLRFHDGVCIISVEDHVAGYIVVNGATSGEGSLYYGISTSTNDYVAFDASLNGTTIPLAGAVAEGEKHLVGNGYTSTTLTGAVDCGTSKFTVANLSLANVQVTGGTLTMGDAFIPSGATVSIPNGAVVIEKASGNGGTIDLGQHNLVVASGTSTLVSGCTITGGYATNSGPAGRVFGTATFVSCVFSGNSTTDTGGALFAAGGASVVTLSGCELTNNKAIDRSGGAFAIQNAKKQRIIDCHIHHNSGFAAINGGTVLLDIVGSTISGNGNPDLHFTGGNILIEGSTVGFAITNSATIELIGSNVFSKLTVSSGAIDVTGNTNAIVLQPESGFVVSGTCTVITSAGATVSIAGGTYTQLNNDGTTVPAQPE